MVDNENRWMDDEHEKNEQQVEEEAGSFLWRATMRVGARKRTSEYRRDEMRFFFPFSLPFSHRLPFTTPPVHENDSNDFSSYRALHRHPVHYFALVVYHGVPLIRFIFFGGVFFSSLLILGRETKKKRESSLHRSVCI